MKKIRINTTCKKMLADIYTPVGIYLRLRDRFRDTILLESTDFHAGENSYSFIGINAIAGIEIKNKAVIEYKYPAQKPEKISIANTQDVPGHLWNFMQQFEAVPHDIKSVNVAQGLFGYTTYDAVQFFDTITLCTKNNRQAAVLQLASAPAGKGVTGNGLLESSIENDHADNMTIPMMRYRLYQYVIIFNHFKDELFICENNLEGLESEFSIVESLIKSKDVPAYPFALTGSETSNMTDEEYRLMVKKGIASCHRGDVFQIVLSRRFQQSFTGDEFNVYRALRSINPSPYLFYFDYGDYKLMGSSPESQLIIHNGKAMVHPIAGTFKRTGDEDMDKALALKLEQDEKENAEHVMLVDLARNDLSRLCNEVEVTQYKKVNYYSHVIHLVSEVKATVPINTNPFNLLSVTFPAGTLSGAPKMKAMQLINEYEPTGRGYYGGAIGCMGFDGSCNHAIMIRTFLSKQNTLVYQAGAGITVSSSPEIELQEVHNKLNALRKAVTPF
jgi:anthranilate synthase component 1